MNAAGNHRETDRRGFTLIELLVVIAIIALLVSLLMPSLKQAKDLARQALCMSNNRLIGLGLQQYAPDNDDWMPAYGESIDRSEYDASDYDGSDGSLRGVVRYALITTWWTDYKDPVLDGNGYFGRYLSAGKKRTKHIIGCPSIPAEPHVDYYTHSGVENPYWIERPKGYGVNYQEATGYDTGGLRDPGPLEMHKIHRPSELVYMCDTCGRAAQVKASFAGREDDWWYETGAIPVARHFDTFSMVFVDGHAESGTMIDRYTRPYFFNDE